MVELLMSVKIRASPSLDVEQFHSSLAVLPATRQLTSPEINTFT
jgi:hypothetical protein